MRDYKNFPFAAAALLLFGTCFFVSPLAAQTAPGDPASSDETIPEKQATKPLEPDQGISAQGLKTGRSESLSDRLDQSNGVITPPRGVDPGIKKEAPVAEPNSSLVIRPAPGNDAK